MHSLTLKMSTLHTAQAASFMPVLLGLAVVTLPVWLPMVIYRRLSGPPLLRG